MAVLLEEWERGRGAIMAWRVPSGAGATTCGSVKKKEEELPLLCERAVRTVEDAVVWLRQHEGLLLALCSDMDE